METVDVSEVTAEQRQHAKQICYGILYGMAAGSLAGELGCSVQEATQFVETFKNRYKGLKSFIGQTVSDCQARGYVKTILHRIRYLPNIGSESGAARAHAERQAVNTTIQGSAADIVKVAMVNIDRVLQNMYPDCALTHCQRSGTEPPRGAHLVLQLHDELLYEVNDSDLTVVINLIKHEMETAMTLRVNLPVKVKVGKNWGEMTEYTFETSDI